ncbi:MAG: pyridoxine 5'-phosphate synthase [Candidatus Omnitrophica bacterium]|nr:pyridoxine 5'-phosphate synthase [Candidatus Omnitrophota bacterium]
MPKLGVNIDHVATLRQARGGNLPNPVYAAFLAEQAGAQSIVAHLREDRRHIQDQDIELLRKKIKTKLNLEMSIAGEILEIACSIRPDQATLVPERRQELTTEGGLNVAAKLKIISRAIKKLRASDIRVSLFIDPDKDQINAAKKSGTQIIEFHTGRYALAKNYSQKEKFFNQLKHAVDYAQTQGLTVNAGHGLDYANVRRIAQIQGIEELNIGYSIICKALYVGLFAAVKEMRELIRC